MSEIDLSLAGSASGLGVTQYAAMQPQHLLLAQEVNLGIVRELVPPTEHIGLSIAPWHDVAADDVVLDHVFGSTSGLAPARAQDAESTLWTDTEFYGGQSRAAIMDWAEKNHYTASDVLGYREMMSVVEDMTGKDGKLPFYIKSMLDGFQGKMLRHTVGRRQRLDNRIEWLIMEAMSKGYISYNDGKIRFNVNFGRPADQHDQAPKSGSYAGEDHDPIGDILAIQAKVYKATGCTINKAECSQKYLNSFYLSKRFRGLTGFTPGSIEAEDMPYLAPGFGPQTAIDIVERQTGVKFRASDNVLRTAGPRVGGKNTTVNTRYFPEDQVIFYVDGNQVAAYDDTEIGFAKTLTSPHPANNWNTGFYAWEKDYGVDPYGHDIGSGVKAFPVFPHMELTYTMKVELPTFL